jgi:hypothetical protein
MRLISDGRPACSGPLPSSIASFGPKVNYRAPETEKWSQFKRNGVSSFYSPSLHLRHVGDYWDNKLISSVLAAMTLIWLNRSRNVQLTSIQENAAIGSALVDAIMSVELVLAIAIVILRRGRCRHCTPCQ